MSELLPGQLEIVAALQTDREQALAQFFQIVRPRLKRIVNFRLDYRLSGRVSESDVLQETFVRAAKRIDHFLAKEEMPFFVWMRLEINQKLHELHRFHFEAGRRDARKEIVFGHPQTEGETSLAIAAHLIGRMSTPSRIVEKAEQIAILEKTLNEMPELDREVIALRHFEELSNIETAQVLGIDPSTASKRYLRALKRLKEIVQAARELEPGSFFGGTEAGLS